MTCEAGRHRPHNLQRINVWYVWWSLPHSRHDLKSLGLMMRNLLVTKSQRSAQFRGSFSSRKPCIASANWSQGRCAWRARVETGSLSMFRMNWISILDVKEINTLEKKEFQAKMFTDYENQYQYFAAAALFLILIEFLLGERKSKWFMQLNLFGSRKKNQKSNWILPFKLYYNLSLSFHTKENEENYFIVMLLFHSVFCFSTKWAQPYPWWQ